MSRVFIAVVAMIMVTLAPAFAEWQLSFGAEADKVGITAPVGAEDFPVGPASYRAVGGNLWALDSAKGRVICVDAAGTMIKDIAIPSLPAEYILDDFALQFTSPEAQEPSAIIVVEAMERLVIKFSTDGRQLFKIKPDNLIQLDEIDIDNNGQFYVGDYANSVIAAFSADGVALHEIVWQCSGFAVDADNNLHTIHFEENIGHFHFKLDATGKELSRVQLGLPEMQNPRLWHVNSKGEFLLSFIPPEGDTNNQILYTYNSAGKILKSSKFKNPYYIKRYLIADRDLVWLVDAEYSKAPAQPIRFRQL